MKVLVTGASGQLGRTLRRIAPEFIYSDIAGEGIEYLDITDAAAVGAFVDSKGIDVIVNCAGYTNVDGAEDNPDAAFLINATAVGNLARAIKARDGLLVHVSTDYIFGGEQLGSPIKEDAKPSPLGVYGRSKLAGEEEISEAGVKHLIFRTAWLYSEYGKNFVKTIRTLSTSKNSLRVVSDQLGTPTYAGDLAEVILLALDKYAAGDLRPGVYNYTDEGVASWFDFARAVVALSGNTTCRVEPCRTGEFPAKAARPAYSVLDKTLVKETFGIEIPHWYFSLQRFMAE